MSAQTISPEALAHSESIPLPETNSIGNQPPSEEANLEKIRELLFGDQVRSNQQQFQTLETQIVTFKTDFEARLERLEDIVNKGFDSITQQIQTERETRETAIAETHRSVQERGDEVTQKQTQLDQRIHHETQLLKQQILDASSQLTESLQQKSQGFQQSINQESQRRQQQERAHKSRISALFGELSERLRDES